VIPEAPFFFSAAAIGMSLASLAGLVVAFRRGDAWVTHDLYRLRQIVEFGFAAALLALFVIPLAATVGGGAAGRVAAVTAFAYLIGSFLVLARRRHVAAVPISAAVILVDGVAIAIATTAVIVGDLTAYQWTLLALLARPMVAFLLFLSTLQPK
jgi:hypothetical protein